MGRYRNLIGEWVETHLKIAKIVAGLVLTMSVAFIIGGSVLVAQNGGSWKPQFESFDDMADRQKLVSSTLIAITI